LEVTNMMKFKMGLLLGFGAGWAVGTGRAAEFWREVQDRASTRTGSRSKFSGSVGGESTPDGSSFNDRTSISA
jgi:hypothetical protein